MERYDYKTAVYEDVKTALDNGDYEDTDRMIDIKSIITHENDMEYEVENAYNSGEYILIDTESEVIDFINRESKDLEMTPQEILKSYDYNNMSDNAIILLSDGKYMITQFC